MFKYIRKINFNNINISRNLNRRFGHGHDAPGKPANLKDLDHYNVALGRLGGAFATVCYFYIMVMFYYDNGKMFGLYQPWLHPHEHHEHHHFEETGDFGDAVPVLLIHDDHEEDDEHEEEHEDEEE